MKLQGFPDEEPSKRLRLRLLGTPRCEWPAAYGFPLEGRKTVALLVWLALHPGAAQSRERLVALLWPDLPEERTRGNLHVALTCLNRALAGTDPPCLVADRRSVRPDPEAPIDVDALELERTLKTVRAAALCDGEFLEGVRLDGCEEFERWRPDTRESLRRAAVEASPSGTSWTASTPWPSA